MNNLYSPSQILIVEDEPIIAADIQDRLETLNYQVVGATDTGAEAIRLAADLKPNLVLMDIMLRGDMDGTEAAAQIRSKMQIPVVFLTANSNDMTFVRARDSQPFGFILKPFDEATLRVNIEIALQIHRMEREREDLIRQLQEALAKVKTLSGLIPLCAWCRKIRSDDGYWKSLEEFVVKDTGGKVTHGVCPDCRAKFAPGIVRPERPKPGLTG